MKDESIRGSIRHDTSFKKDTRVLDDQKLKMSQMKEKREKSRWIPDPDVRLISPLEILLVKW